MWMYFEGAGGMIGRTSIENDPKMQMHAYNDTELNWFNVRFSFPFDSSDYDCFSFS